jgi:hypothetical protein
MAAVGEDQLNKMAEECVKVESRQRRAQRRGQPVSSYGALKSVVEAVDQADVMQDVPEYDQKLKQGKAYPWGEKKDFSIAPGMVMIYDITDTKPALSGGMSVAPIRARPCYNGMTFAHAVRNTRVAGIAEGSFNAAKSADDQTEDRAQTLIRHGGATTKNTSSETFSYGDLIGFRPASVIVEKNTEQSGQTAVSKILPACVAQDDSHTAFRPVPYVIRPYDFISKFNQRAEELIELLSQPRSATEDAHVDIIRTHTWNSDRPRFSDVAQVTAAFNDTFKKLYNALMVFMTKDCPDLCDSLGVKKLVFDLATKLFLGADNSASVAIAAAQSVVLFEAKDQSLKNLSAVWRDANDEIPRDASGFNKYLLRKCFSQLQTTGENLRDAFEMQTGNIVGKCLKDSAPEQNLDIHLF